MPLSLADLTPSDWFMQVVVFVIVSYPIVGGCAFIVSGTYYHLFRERRDRPRFLEHGEPFVTILVPAHNEEEQTTASTSRSGTRRATSCCPTTPIPSPARTRCGST